MKGHKISAPIAAGALVVILGWVLKTWGAIEVPTEVAVGFTTLFTIIISLMIPDAIEADQ